MTKILAIESSCDDTGVAVYDSENGLLAHSKHTQWIHEQYGGTVPELASRDHVTHCIGLVDHVLTESGCKGQDLEALAYTAGPGLIGALLVGASIAKSLAFAWDKPCLPIHHLEGHLMAPMLDNTPPAYPFLALLVSGGHTMIIKVAEFGHYEILGQSLDDAAGEAFDKVAKLMGLGYPGGPAIEAYAKRGNPDAISLPRPMLNRPGFDFSFSGLKTAVLTQWKKLDPSEQSKCDMASSFQTAVIDTLVTKTERALSKTGLSRLVVAGGVMANQALRDRLADMADTHRIQICYPRVEFCTDNGAMIAYAGYQRYRQHPASHLSIDARARWLLSD